MTALTLALLSVLPAGPQTRYRIEQVERNHLYNCEGEHQFTHYIGYSWHDTRYEIEWWIDDEKIVLHEPGRKRLWVSNGTVIEYEIFSESWTQLDPEFDDRDRRPPSVRAGQPEVRRGDRN